jgi:ABC-2 type transport system permease protein
VGGALGPGLADALASFSLLSHFEAAQRGVLELRSLFFYLGFIGLWLTLNTIWVSARKGG